MTPPLPLARRTPRRAAVLLVAPLLALTACSGSGEEGAAPAPATASSGAAQRGGEALEVVQAALASTRDAGTARLSLVSDSTIGDTPFEVTGEGLVALAGDESQLTLTLPFGEVQQRTVDGTAYVSLPQQAGVFYSIDADELSGSPLGGSADPSSPLAALEAVGEAEEAGEEEVRGEPTTRYDGTIDVQQALAASSPQLRELAETSLGATGLDAVPFSVWLDDEGRVRRFVQELSLPATAQTQGQPVESTTTVELYDYGVEVDVQAPPADQVRDGSQLLGSLPGGSGPGGGAAGGAAPETTPSS